MSLLGRMAGGPQQVEDVRLQQVAVPDEVKQRFPSMAAFEAQVNQRLSLAEQRLNELAQAVRTMPTQAAAVVTSETATSTGTKGDKGDKGDPGEPGPAGPRGPQGPAGSGDLDGNIDGGRPDEDFTGLDPVDGDTP